MLWVPRVLFVRIASLCALLIIGLIGCFVVYSEVSFSNERECWRMERPQQSSASSANSNRPRRRFNKRNASNFANTTALLKIVIRNWKSLDQMELQVAQIYSAGSYGLNFAFDEGYWRATVQQERDAIQATTDWKQSLNIQQDTDQDKDQPQGDLETEKAISGTEISSANCLNTEDSSCQKPTVTATGPQISVRTLYVVPPKETSRRGNRTGLAYFVWTVDPATNEHKDRTTLYRALEALQASISIFNESDQQTIQIQEAANGKAWKEPTSFPSEVGSVFQTDHYKQFLQSSQDRLEQRLSRPKPSPGGGAVPVLNPSANLASAPTAMANATEEPVATLVQYLQRKHEEEKKRKALRKKERKKKDEESANTANGSSTAATKSVSSKPDANGTSSAAAAKKRTRRQRKKKNGKP